MEKKESKKEKKRGLREDWRILMRGIRICLEICPQYFMGNIIFQIGRMVSPYFALYMSAELVNELSGRCERERLLTLAAVTVLGLFAIKALNRMVQARRNVWINSFFQQKEAYIFEKQNGFQYEHLENPEVTLLRERIFADENATGSGLAALFWSIPDLARNGMDLIVSVFLTFSIFRKAVDVNLSGFLGFVNSPVCTVLLAAIILLYAALSVRFTKSRQTKAMKALSGLAETNMLLSVYDKMRGEDVAIFNIKKLVLKLYKEELKPSWLTESEHISIRYSTIGIYENDGIDLSGGEEQKVALARALYKDAPFVILDEPTAALDPIAEAAVYESFQRLVENKTAVFISHRLSSCRFCDDIIVFDKGRMVQRGCHDVLGAEDGKYRDLWNAQAQYYA